MESLKFLDLSCNQIGVLPPTLAKLKCLRTLMLFNNKISEWPDALCDLIELHTLWLGKNELKRLPARFGHLKHLDWGVYPLSSNIDDNPLMSPPLNVCQLGIQAIGAYLGPGLAKRNSLI
jgi:Leucine-rich repeat (LRR) protein